MHAVSDEAQVARPCLALAELLYSTATSKLVLRQPCSESEELVTPGQVYQAGVASNSRQRALNCFLHVIVSYGSKFLVDPCFALCAALVDRALCKLNYSEEIYSRATFQFLLCVLAKQHGEGLQRSSSCPHRQHGICRPTGTALHFVIVETIYHISMHGICHHIWTATVKSCASLIPQCRQFLLCSVRFD